MACFDDNSWNLCQAALWIEFRDQAYVERHGDADSESYSALHWYPEPDQPLQIADVGELLKALKNGKLEAFGFPGTNGDKPEQVPKVDWEYIDLRPPLALTSVGNRREMWRKVRVRKGDVLRLWPSLAAKRQEPWYDWSLLREIYNQVQSEHPNLSARKRSAKICELYEIRFGPPCPSRPAIDAKIKHWQTLAT